MLEKGHFAGGTKNHVFVNISGTAYPIKMKFNRVLWEPETHTLELVPLKSVQPLPRKSSELHTHILTHTHTHIHTDIFQSRRAESIGI